MRVELFVPAWSRKEYNAAEDRKSPMRKMREAALLQMDGLPPAEGPVKLHVIIVCARPESHFDRHGDVRRQFADAVPECYCPLSTAGHVEQALSGIVYKSATQIHSVLAERRYGPSGIFAVVTW